MEDFPVFKETPEMTEADIDAYVLELGNMLKAKMRTAKRLDEARKKDLEAHKNLSIAKDNLRNVHFSMMGI